MLKDIIINNFIPIYMKIRQNRQHVRKTTLTQMSQKEIDNLDSPLSIGEIYSVVEFFPQGKIRIQMPS